LSVNEILECNYYNQGCNGGYSFLVSKYFHEYGMHPKQCYKKGLCHSKCTGENEYLNKLKLKVKDYYFVGGYYGGANEENMLEELKKNGPFTVGIEVIRPFYQYSSGIFSFGKKKKFENKEWQSVNHSILLVGYGIENGIEYWEIMNSWGERWGNNGFAKIKKGENIMSIGSLGESATVEIEEIDI
jgi:cathepsin C